jgi:hypothetical protein
MTIESIPLRLSKGNLGSLVNLLDEAQKEANTKFP